MKPGPFSYHRPSTVQGAVELLAESEDAEVLAGGQSLIPMMNFRRKHPGTLVDINRLDDLDYVTRNGDEIRIGAMARQSDVAASEIIGDGCPLVQEALSYVGHKPTRHRGTIGGNMANADPVSELPAVMITQEATFVITGPDGKRTVSADDFFEGKMQTVLGHGELLTEIRLPTLGEDEGYAFTEQRPRDHGWAVAGLSVTLSVSDDTVERCRLVYTGVADRAHRIEQAEDCVVGESPGPTVFSTAGEIARKAVDPPSRDEVTADDLKNNQRTGPTEHPHASAHASPELRKQLVETFTKRALTTAAERAVEA